MRLIDADKLLKRLQGTAIEPAPVWIRNEIINAPTVGGIDMINRSKLIEELMKGHDKFMQMGDRAMADMIQETAKYVYNFPCYDGALPLDAWLDMREGNDGRIDV